MSLLHIRLEDVRRVSAVLSDMQDSGGMKIGDLWDEIRPQASEPPPPPAPGFRGFANPPPPLQNIEKTLRNGIATVRAAIEKRYGADYASDLWERVQR